MLLLLLSVRVVVVQTQCPNLATLFVSAQACDSRPAMLRPTTSSVAKRPAAAVASDVASDVPKSPANRRAMLRPTLPQWDPEDLQVVYLSTKLKVPARMLWRYVGQNRWAWDDYDLTAGVAAHMTPFSAAAGQYFIHHVRVQEPRNDAAEISMMHDGCAGVLDKYIALCGIIEKDALLAILKLQGCPTPDN